LTTGSFPHDNFSSVYWIFTKRGHMIPLWKGKNPIYFGVITNIPFDNLYRRAYFVIHTFLVFNDIAKMYIFYHLIGVNVSMLVLSVVDCGHIKPNYKIYICCFLAKQAELRSKSKVWLSWHHDNVSKKSDITCLPTVPMS
jgi:hypothetical protein